MRVLVTVILVVTSVWTAQDAVAEGAWIFWYQRALTIGEKTNPWEWEVVGSTDTFEESQELQNRSVDAHFQRLIKDPKAPFTPDEIDKSAYTRGTMEAKDFELAVR